MCRPWSSRRFPRDGTIPMRITQCSMIRSIPMAAGFRWTVMVMRSAPTFLSARHGVLMSMDAGYRPIKAGPGIRVNRLAGPATIMVAGFASPGMVGCGFQDVNGHPHGCPGARVAAMLAGLPCRRPPATETSATIAMRATALPQAATPSFRHPILAGPVM